MLLQLALLHSFLWLSYTSLCICTTCSLSIPVNGHLGCFHVLAIVNSAAIRMHASFWIIEVLFKRITIVLSFPCWGRIISSCKSWSGSVHVFSLALSPWCLEQIFKQTAASAITFQSDDHWSLSFSPLAPLSYCQDHQPK